MHGKWTNDEELAEAFQKDTADKNMIISTRFGNAECWALIGNLQLALSHPENVGPSADIARNIAHHLIREVAKTPAEIEVARRGWVRAHFVEPESAGIKQ